MKKIILITIICFAIPCFGFAQEPNSLLGIDNTLWQKTLGEEGDLGFGFYGGKVYLIWPLEGGEPEMAEISFYVDLLLLSFVLVDYSPDIVPWEVFLGGTGFLFPILGIGYLIEPDLGVHLVTKLQDDWTP